MDLRWIAEQKNETKFKAKFCGTFTDYPLKNVDSHTEK